MILWAHSLHNCDGDYFSVSGLRYLPVFTGGTLIHEYLKQDQDVIRAGKCHASKDL